MSNKSSCAGALLPVYPLPRSKKPGCRRGGLHLDDLVYPLEERRSTSYPTSLPMTAWRASTAGAPGVGSPVTGVATQSVPPSSARCTCSGRRWQWAEKNGAAQHTGLGTELLQHAETIAREMGLSVWRSSQPWGRACITLNAATSGVSSTG